MFSKVLRPNSRSATAGEILSAIQTLSGNNSFPIAILNLSLPFLTYLFFLMLLHKVWIFKTFIKSPKYETKGIYSAWKSFIFVGTNSNG